MRDHLAAAFACAGTMPGSGSVGGSFRRGLHDADVGRHRRRVWNSARLANDQNTRIYTIGLGPLVDDAFLTNIANLGGGQYYKAPSTADLAAAFQSIAEQTHISLVK